MRAGDCPIRGRASLSPHRKAMAIWQLPVYLVLSWSCLNNSNVCTGFKNSVRVLPLYWAISVSGIVNKREIQAVKPSVGETDGQGWLRVLEPWPWGLGHSFRKSLQSTCQVWGLQWAQGVGITNTAPGCGGSWSKTQHRAVMSIRWLYSSRTIASALGKGQGTNFK